MFFLHIQTIMWDSMIQGITEILLKVWIKYPLSNNNHSVIDIENWFHWLQHYHIVAINNKSIKTAFLFPLNDIVSKTILKFDPFFVRHNFSCNVNPDFVSMFLKIWQQFNTPCNGPCINILPIEDKYRSQAAKTTTVCIVCWSEIYGEQNRYSILPVTFVLLIEAKNIGCSLSSWSGTWNLKILLFKIKLSSLEHLNNPFKIKS